MGGSLIPRDLPCVGMCVGMCMCGCVCVGGCVWECVCGDVCVGMCVWECVWTADVLKVLRSEVITNNCQFPFSLGDV